MTATRIDVFLGSSGWMARFSGNDSILRLFGTDTLPTGFMPGAKAERVVAELQARNPGVDVVALPAGEPVYRLTTNSRKAEAAGADWQEILTRSGLLRAEGGAR
jgi:hypothetical protein